MSRHLRAAFLLALLAGCGGAAKPPAAGPGSPAGTSDRERAACDHGDPPVAAIGLDDDAPLRRPRSLRGPVAERALLGDLPPPATAPSVREGVDGLGPIKRIKLMGFRFVAPETLRAAMTLREGDRPTTRALQKDVRALYATGLLDDIQVRFEGDEDHCELMYVLVERPPRGEIYFRGASALSATVLREVAAIGEHPSTAMVSAAVGRLRARYAEAGREETEITVRQRRFQGQLDLCFRIHEAAEAAPRGVEAVTR